MALPCPAEGKGRFSIGKILGRAHDQAIDLPRIKLDIVGRRQETAGHVDHIHLQGKGWVDGIGAAADGRRVGIELEGIEGGEAGGVFGLVGGKARDNAKIGLDGDEFAVALVLYDRVVNDLAAGEARGGHLDAVLFLAAGALRILGETGAADGLERCEGGPLDGIHHPRAVLHVHGGVNGDADQTDADHACKAGAGHPFEAVARALVAQFTEVYRR